MEHQKLNGMELGTKIIGEIVENADAKYNNGYKKPARLRNSEIPLKEALVTKRSVKVSPKGTKMYMSGFIGIEDKQYRRTLPNGMVYISRRKPLRFNSVNDARLVANFQRARGVPTRTIKTANGYVNLSRVGINPRWYLKRN